MYLDDIHLPLTLSCLSPITPPSPPSHPPSASMSFYGPCMCTCPFGLSTGAWVSKKSVSAAPSAITCKPQWAASPSYVHARVLIYPAHAAPAQAVTDATHSRVQQPCCIWNSRFCAILHLPLALTFFQPLFPLWSPSLRGVDTNIPHTTGHLIVMYFQYCD